MTPVAWPTSLWQAVQVGPSVAGCHLWGWWQPLQVVWPAGTVLQPTRLASVSAGRSTPARTGASTPSTQARHPRAKLSRITRYPVPSAFTP